MIEKVVKNHKNKTFDIFSEEDLANEIWIICLNAIESFDTTKVKASNPLQSLENYLNSVLYRRLANLYRNEYGSKLKPRSKDTESTHQFRIAAAHPTSLSADLDVPMDEDFLDDHNSIVLARLIDEIDLADFELISVHLSNNQIGTSHRQKLKNFTQLMQWVHKDEFENDDED